MSDWGLPTLTSAYTNFLSYLKGRDDDAVRLNDTRVTAATNLPDYAKRWNETLGLFQNWLSGAWGALRLAVAGGGTGADNAADARTNLGAASSSDLSTHIADQASPHGATSAATASKTMARDGSGRAKVAAPSASDDIARKQEVDDHAALTNPHSATAAATVSRLPIRDSAGRFQVATPSAAADVATKGYVDGVAKVVQVVTSTVATYLTLTTVLTVDDSIPAIGEGDQIISLSITPGAVGRRLVVEFTAPMGGSGVTNFGVALFIGSVCYAAAPQYSNGSLTSSIVKLQYIFTVQSVTAHTISVRSGPHAGGYSVYVNGNSSGRLFGGKAAAVLTATEIV
jgi:hypothetical protein